MSRAKLFNFKSTLIAVLVTSFFLPQTGVSIAQQNAPPTVEVAVPLVKKTIDWDEYTGQFQAVETVEIRARVSGYLESVNFDEGSLVKKGDLLFQIDARPFEAEMAQAQAQLEVAQAQQTLASVQNERALALLKRSVGSQANADDALAQLSQANANVELAKARILSAELNLEFTKITAPLSGRISATNLDVGNLVSGTGATEALANIVSLNPIEFSFTASESAYLKYARLGFSNDRPSSRTKNENRNKRDEVRVKLSDEDNWNRKGFMSFVDNRLDPNSGTIEGRALFDNEDLFLQPGIYGRLRLIGSEEYTALFIPDEAIQSDQSRKIVFVIDKENVASERAVILGPIQNGMRVIREGLEAEDRVVVRGVQRVRSGAPVTPEVVELSFDEAVN